MKKQWIIVTIGMLFGWIASDAQNNIQYGLSGGVGFSNFNYTALNDLPIFSHDPIVSYNINGYIGIRPNQRFGLSFEPGYSRRGGKVGLLPDIIPIQGAWKMEYLQVPALLDFYLSDRLSVSVGPELSWRLDSNADFLGLISEDLDKKFSAGLLAGIQFSVHPNVDVGLRYHRALTPVATLNLPEIGNVFKPRVSMLNQNFQFIARYRF